MNFHITKGYKNLKNDLLEIISNINSYQNEFDTGKRNSIKKVEVSNKVIIIKAFKIPNVINQIVYRYFRKSKARRSFEFATNLINLDIKTPAPIAYIEDFTLLGLKRSYYISEFVDYDITYRELSLQSEREENEVILRAFTKFTYGLHEKEIIFLDHSPGNTLIIKKNIGFDFYLVDLNRMKFGKLDFEDRMKNFSRLTPEKDMIQFMSEEYAKLSGENVERVFNSMWNYTQKFQKKFQRKLRLKKKLLNK